MSAPRRTLLWGWLGRVAYGEAEGLQGTLARGVKAGTAEEHLLLLEHPHVFTLGRNADEADLGGSRARLAAEGAEVRECDRGGQVTYHGPGQLVGYPIVDLSPDRRDVRRYVRDLEEVLLRTLADYGVAGERRDGKEYIGVWAGERKIASIGVHLSRWVTTHGFALNVGTDLSWFGKVVPCGLHGVEMASIASLTGERPPLHEVAARAAGHVAEVFGRRLRPLAPASLPWPGAPSAGAGAELVGAPGEGRMAAASAAGRADGRS